VFFIRALIPFTAPPLPLPGLFIHLFLSSAFQSTSARISKRKEIEKEHLRVVTAKTRVNIMDPLPIASSKFLESLSLWVHPKSRLLICFDKNCRHAISPNGSRPTNHLRDKHDIPLSRRKGLSKVLAKLELKSPDGAAPLLDGSPHRPPDTAYCLYCAVVLGKNIFMKT
jgi:hypothetical protein